MEYNFKQIEKKWQDYWYANNTFAAKQDFSLPKYYCLVEFPYPSGQGLHVGHPRSYTALDIVARKKRLQGYNVLYPMGWDAFGLPTENYALKNHINPEIVTAQNVARFKSQLQALGLSFDVALKVMSGTPAGKGHFTTSWPNKVLKGDLSPSFMIDLAHKDLGIALDVANQLHVPMPLGAASREVYNQARAAGRGREDWTAILEQVRNSAGLPNKFKM